MMEIIWRINVRNSCPRTFAICFTSSSDRALPVIPAAILVIMEIASTGSPECDAAILSNTVDIPTASPPIARNIRISAGGFILGTVNTDIDTVVQRHSAGLCRLVGKVTQFFWVNMTHIRKTCADFIIIGSCSVVFPVKLIWSSITMKSPAEKSVLMPPAALVRITAFAPKALSTGMG